MDFNEVTEMVSIFDNSSLNYMDLTLDNCHICMDKSANRVRGKETNENAITINEENLNESEIKILNEAMKEEIVKGNYIKSPIVGTFYSSSSPESEPFIKVGDKVKKGQVVCIIESMKLMNEIESDFDGEIVEVLVQDGSVVEYGEKLFRII